MASKAKSGLTSVRQYWEDILVPPNKFTIGAPSFTSAVRDGKGHAALHAAATNDTPGTLNVFQAWQSGGPFVLTAAVVTGVDPGGSGLQIADITTPIVRRFVQIQFLPSTALGGAFELGAYFQPHADTGEASVSGSGPSGGGTPANRPTFATGQAIVAAKGNAVPLSPVSVKVPSGFSVFFTFLKANTGTNVYVGNSKANAQNHSVAKILNSQNAGLRLFVTDVSSIFIDADNNGDGVDWIVEQ